MKNLHTETITAKAHKLNWLGGYGMPATLMAMLLVQCMALPVQAQFGFFHDVARLSADKPMGTARTLGMGGATQALGADFGNLTGNPAGLGWYQKGEFVTSMGLGLASSTGSYLGEKASTDKQHFYIPNVGFVVSNANTEGAKWLKNYTLAFGLNRQGDYNGAATWTGLSSGIDENSRAVSNGLVQHYLDIANRGDIRTDIIRRPFLFPLEQQIRSAYSIYMLDSTTTGGRFTSFVPPADYRQNGLVTTRGSRNSLDLAGSININDRVTVGAAMGMGIYSYTETRLYTEQFARIYYAPAPDNIPKDSTYRGARYSLQDVTSTSGLSFNMRVGAQVAVTEALRWGLSVQLPTVYAMSQSYENTLAAFYPGTVQTSTRNGQRFEQNLPREPFRGPFVVPAVVYTVTTPWRFSTGLAYVFGKRGLLTADVDYVDYTSASIRSDEFSPVADNNAIKQVYNAALNVRAGGELRLEKWRVRGGYAFQGNPYKNDPELGYYFNRGTTTYTAGLGYREPSFYVDFTASLMQFRQGFTAHTFTRRADIDQSIWNLQATLGVPF